MKKKLLSILVMLSLAVTNAWAQDPDWLQAGDTWDEATKTLTVNSNHIYTYEKITEIVNLIFSDGVTTIGEYAFFECTGLREVTIGNKVKSISQFAFQGCANLTTVTIGSAVTKIDYQAFGWCIRLTTLTVYAAPTCSLITDALFRCRSLSNIYVPADKVEAFKNATGWSAYSEIISAITPVVVAGDLNEDGKVDIADAVSVLDLMAEGKEDSAADLNGDGKVDIADFVSVLDLMAEQ